MICRFRLNVQWPVNNPVVSLHCFLSKAMRSLHSLSEGLPMKTFDCLIPGAAAQCSECLCFGLTLTFILPTQGEIETTGSGPRDGLLDRYLAKISASSLPWIPQSPGTQRSVTLFQLAHNSCRHSQANFDVTLDAFGCMRVEGYK
jgi:hypothetical protein